MVDAVAIEHVLPVRVGHFTLNYRRLIDDRWWLNDDRRTVDGVRIVVGVWVIEERVVDEAAEVMEAVVAVVMAVPTVSPALAGRRVRPDREDHDGENEDEHADHTDLRSPGAARPGRNLAGAALART